MSLISRVWGLECSWGWQGAEKLWRLGNARSRLSQQPPSSGGSWHLRPWVPLAHRGHSAQCGTAVAVAGMAPDPSPCRLQHGLNQILSERIKSGNTRCKFYGRKDMDPNPS